MKKLFLLTTLLLATKVLAQEAPTPIETPPFYTDTTFWLFAGGALFLILVLIIKKIIEKKNNKTDNYENTNI